MTPATTLAAATISSLALEASHLIRSYKGHLMGLIGHNSGPTQYIQVHNSVTLPANGAVPVISFVATTNEDFALPNAPTIGFPFSIGIFVCNSSTLATKTIGAADCLFTAVTKYDGTMLQGEQGEPGEQGEAGGGTVTSASIVTANGVSGTTANATSTPAHTITLGAITPSSVTTPIITSTGALALTSAAVGDITIIPNSTGKVGVGTASPGAKLDVVSTSGAVPLIRASDGAAGPQMRMWSNAASTYCMFEFWKDSTPTKAMSIGMSSLDNGGGGTLTDSIVFNTFTGAVWGERLRISNAGGVCIGTTTDPGAGNLLVSGKVAIGTGAAPVVSLDILATTNYRSVGAVQLQRAQSTNAPGLVMEDYSGGSGTGGLAALTFFEGILYCIDRPTTGDVAAGDTIWSVNTLRNLVLNQPFFPKTYTVAVAAALSPFPAAGAIVDISDEAGGATPARSNGTIWKRLTDLATIS